jgi:hypothetical protein
VPNIRKLEESAAIGRQPLSVKYMKKFAVTIGLWIIATGVFAQGYVSFYNGPGLLVSTNDGLSSQFVLNGGNGTFGPIALANTTAFLFAVLVQPYNGTITSDTNVWDGTWHYTGLITVNIQAFLGRIVALSDVQVQNWGVGVTNQFIIAGWSVSLGSTWNDVSDLIVDAEAVGGFDIPGYFGVSSVGFAAAGPSPPGFPSTLWSTAGPQSYGNPIGTGLTLYELPLTITVPEPSTIVLGGLGGLSLLLFRRRS